MLHRILVVEDDQDIRETLVEVLTDLGFAVASAADGLEALAQLREPEDAWCMVLLDLMMPHMDGREFRVEQLRDPALARIPVVIVSAVADVTTVANELGVDAHVTKPVTVTKLVEAVERYCPRSRRLQPA